MNIFIRSVPTNCSETELINTLKPYLSALGLEPSEYEVAKPKGKWYAVMRVSSKELAEEFLEQYGGAATGIKVQGVQGKSLKFDYASSQDEEDVAKIREENEAAGAGCGCVVQ